MSLVRVLGSARLACGCVVGRYHELATHRDVTYIEEKGLDCRSVSHRRNHTVPEETSAASAPRPAVVISRAS